MAEVFAEEDFRFPHTDLIESFVRECFVRESYAVSGCFLSRLVDCSIRASENFLLRYFAETGFFNFHRCQDAVGANTQSIKENTRSGDAQFLWASDCAVRVFLRNLHYEMIFVGRNLTLVIEIEAHNRF